MRDRSIEMCRSVLFLIEDYYDWCSYIIIHLLNMNDIWIGWLLRANLNQSCGMYYYSSNTHGTFPIDCSRDYKYINTKAVLWPRKHYYVNCNIYHDHVEDSQGLQWCLDLSLKQKNSTNRLTGLPSPFHRGIRAPLLNMKGVSGGRSTKVNNPKCYAHAIHMCTECVLNRTQNRWQNVRQPWIWLFHVLTFNYWKHFPVNRWYLFVLNPLLHIYEISNIFNIPSCVFHIRASFVKIHEEDAQKRSIRGDTKDELFFRRGILKYGKRL